MDCITNLMEKLLSESSTTEESKSLEEEMGSKTASLSDPKDYPSDQLHEVLDVGDLPTELKEEAWDVLLKHVKVFGFDGHLKNYPAKARIRTIEGSNPISLPMYASSPAKREFIDQQIDLWYMKGIIEPS